jgi:hypothetical protein
MTRRIARGVITFEYNFDEDPHMELYGEEMSDEEKLEYFLNTMVDDVIDLRHSDIKPAIEMSLVELDTAQVNH